MPRSAAVRKLNDLIKRARLARVCNQIFVVVFVVVIDIFTIVIITKTTWSREQDLQSALSLAFLRFQNPQERQQIKCKKVLEFVHLSYFLQVLALIVGELHEAMPVVFGKEAKKKNLLKHLEQTIEVGRCCNHGWWKWNSCLWPWRRERTKPLVVKWCTEVSHKELFINDNTMSKLQSVEAKHGTCTGDLPPLDTLRHEIVNFVGMMLMLVLMLMLIKMFMVTVLKRLWWIL